MLSKNMAWITIPQHFGFLIGLILIAIGVFSPWWLVVAYLGWFVLGFIGFNIFYHRYHSHDAFKTHPALVLVGSYLGLLCGRGTPFFMVNHHVPLHHRFADQAQDPHTPKKGFWHAFIWWQNDRRAVVIRPSSRKILKDKSMKFMANHYYKIFWLTFLVLFAIDIPFALFFMLGGGTLQGISEGIIATCGHGYGDFGKQDHELDDNSRNLRGPFNWITLGSGLHNNHHKNPNSFTYKIEERDFDFAATVIKLIAIPNSLRT